MVKRHLKRITTPKTWPITRKETTFVKRPFPAGHPVDQRITILTLLKDMLGLAHTARTARFILNTQEVLVNGKRRRNPADSAGLLDVVTFPATKTSFRIVIDEKKKLAAIPIAGKESTLVPSQIKQKTLLKSKKLQLGFHNGKTLLVKKDTYKVGDTLLLNLENKEEAHFPFAKEAFVLVLRGKHVGLTGVVEKIENGLIIFKNGKENILTEKTNAIVLGTKSAAVKIA